MIATYHNQQAESNRYKSAVPHDDIVAEMELKPSSTEPPYRREVRSGQKRECLDSLLERERLLSEAAQKPVVFSPPLISRGEGGVIGRGTINIIQGAFGSHKSRFAELLAALMLTTNDLSNDGFLGFKRAVLERFCVCYIDTERNQKEELPAAIQGIKLRAGYRLDETPELFRFTSIKGDERKDRFDAIETFIRHVRSKSELHLFCLIDVVTDAVGDFNDPKESMKLFDFLGNLCDDCDATFLLVIHQNPGTEKARGHIGTEAANKASTVLQIGIEKDADGKRTDLIKLRSLKLRRGKPPEDIYLQFDEESNSLRLADPDAIARHLNSKVSKATVEEVTQELEMLLADGPVPKSDIVIGLESTFEVSNATIRGRIKQIKEKKVTLRKDGSAFLLGEGRNGASHCYYLKAVGDQADKDILPTAKPPI
jgi:hypothetical protein